MKPKAKMLVYTPFTGLGMYGGFRGNRWLRNRITVFKEFVVPALLNQTDHEFVHWISWREEERDNEHVKELGWWLSSNLPGYKFVFTYGGVCFWDDKYNQVEARDRLFWAFKKTLPVLMDEVSDCEYVDILLQPSDDLYDSITVESIKKALNDQPSINAVGFTKGYLIDYTTKKVLEYNPKTNPPFFCYRIPRNLFVDPGKHMNFISTKTDEGQYPAGTPYPSHEWIPNAFKLGFFDTRGFMVGTHGENISTHFNHPYGGVELNEVQRANVLDSFGIRLVPPVEIPFSLRKSIMRKLPYRAQRKVRYIFGEMVYNRLYNFIRN